MLLNWVCGVWCRLASRGLSPVFCWFSGFPNDTPGGDPWRPWLPSKDHTSSEEECTATGREGNPPEGSPG